MKIVRFSIGEQIKYGILKGETINPVQGNIFEDYQVLEEEINLKDAKLLSPVEPGKVIIVGLNYSEHVGELNGIGTEKPVEPITFLVANTAISGNLDIIRLNSYEHRVDYEAELVAVIGKECKQVEEAKALDYVLGYTCGNDVSDRDNQKQDGQWTRAKSYPTYKPMGPWIETELDPNNLDIQCLVNGEVKQNSNTKHMIFSTAQLVAFLSQYMTLYPGDVIFTGTPNGVGPIKKGDNVEVKIKGLATLTNQVE